MQCTDCFMPVYKYINFSLRECGLSKSDVALKVHQDNEVDGYCRVGLLHGKPIGTYYKLSSRIEINTLSIHS